MKAPSPYIRLPRFQVESELVPHYRRKVRESIAGAVWWRRLLRSGDVSEVAAKEGFARNIRWAKSDAAELRSLCNQLGISVGRPAQQRKEAA